jgi:phosphoribosyl-ATP pyrophosphohydrolase/phosphoribosyl-AMP cyclohydrolase/histidinol dehydrogenase
MTAIAARAAGVRRVVVASPNASDVMLAAAAIAGADEFLCAGGAHAIGALAYGVDGLAPCDVIVGPGNRWVTAAKRIVSGDVAIDMLAGPSELVVIADDGADPEIVAADLLAQAEHDPDATAGLITTSERLARTVDNALERRLRDLQTADIARRSLLDRGFVCVVESLEEAAKASDAFAPEHLQLSVRDPDALRSMIGHAGAIFAGERTAEVFGDYGVGPNHTLPTGGAARRSAGLSVMHFLRVRTWIRMDNASDLAGVIHDAASMARIEGLEAHARAAEARLTFP